MKRIIASILFFVALLTFATAPPFIPSGYAANGYGATALTGGTAGCLDAINGATLLDGDKAFVTTTTTFYIYSLDDDSAAAESSPNIISPDTSAGDKRWILLTYYGISDTAFTPAWDAVTTISPSKNAVYDEMQQTQLIKNLKPAVNASVNKLDVFTKTGGAVPDATNVITVAIHDGNGYTFRSRAAAYLSGTSQFILADAANYWTKGTLDAEIKTAYVYAIWDGTGIVWALSGYSGFNMVPTTTTVTDDDYFLLEASSTYTRDNAHYCVAVAKIRYQYDTADTPDHTIQATVLDAPQVIWNPKSDYGYQKNLATTNTSGSDIAAYSAISVVVKQSGKYHITIKTLGVNVAPGVIAAIIRTGSSTYASATLLAESTVNLTANGEQASAYAIRYLNAGDTIHHGAICTGASGNRSIHGDNTAVGRTSMTFHRTD